MNERDTPESSPEQPVGNPDTYGRARRRLMMTLAAGGGAFAAAHVLPKEWTRPIINSIVVPAHAQASLFVGMFSTTSLSGSIFDLFVQPLHAAPLGSVVVGNVAFVATWDVLEDSYILCGEGTVGGSIPFDIEGKAGRSGNALNDISICVPNGTLEIVDQTVGPGGIEFTATYDGAETSASAAPGGSCTINVLTSVRMSSPYPDDGRA